MAKPEAMYESARLERFRGWAAETFLLWHCNDTQSASLNGDSRVRAVMFRMLGYSRETQRGGDAMSAAGVARVNRSALAELGCMCSRYRHLNGACNGCGAEGEPPYWSPTARVLKCSRPSVPTPVRTRVRQRVT